MKIGIIGAGSMGCVFAWMMKNAGHDITLYDSDPHTVNSIGEGLNVYYDNQITTLLLKIYNEPSVLKTCEIVFLFVKSYSTRSAMSECVPFLGNDCIVVSLQNGIGNMEIIQSFISPELIVFGTTSIGAYKTSASNVRIGGMGETVIGGARDASVRVVYESLTAAGIRVSIVPDPDTAVWRKAIVNAGINPLGALFRIPNGKILESEHLRTVQEMIVREAVLIARLHGLEFDVKDMIAFVQNVCQRTSANRCSMLQDIENNRVTEIDSINGYLIRIAGEKNIDVPYNKTVYSFIKYLEKR